MLFMQ